jgi:hypothetical protein
VRKEAGEMLAALQHPDNINIALGAAVEDQIIEIIRRGKTLQTGGKVATVASHARVVSQQANPSHDRVYEPVGSRSAAAASDMR